MTVVTHVSGILQSMFEYSPYTFLGPVFQDIDILKCKRTTCIIITSKKIISQVEIIYINKLNLIQK